MKTTKAVELSIEQVRRRTDLSSYHSRSAETSRGTFVGQSRAVRAMEFGLTVDQKGYNTFIVGLPGCGRTSYALSSLKDKAASMKASSDWVYVFNFDDPARPLAMELPAGQGPVMEQAFTELLEELKTAINRAFEKGAYEEAKAQKINRFQENISDMMSRISDEAEEQGFAVKRTPQGFINIPLKKGTDEEGEPVELPGEEFEKLPKKEKKRLKAISDKITSRTLEVLRQIREQERSLKVAITELETELCRHAIEPCFEELVGRFGPEPKLINWLESMQKNIIANFGFFLAAARDEAPEVDFSPFKVNVLVSHSPEQGAPVVWETNPTYYNLGGKLEYESRQGYYHTDFTHIVAGALHRANGGFLIIDAEQLLRNFMSYDLLKRALRSDEILMESLGDQFGSVPVMAPRPEAIPLKTKVVLIGNHEIYYLLQAYDPEFPKLFKLVAQFDYEMDRTADAEKEIASLIVRSAKDNGLLSFDRSAMEEIIEWASRLAEDQGKLSVQFNRLFEMVAEASSWAVSDGSKKVHRRHVVQAIAGKRERSALVEEKFRENFETSVIRIDTTGNQVGQINGLAIVSFADVSFGHPCRITANTFMGSGGVVNIERETNMAGPIHNKGLLTLSSYFGRIYAQDMPLNFSARIAFEQNYGGIDGDSASSTELYCLLSSLADVPIRQDIAVTGSVDQFGNIQAIGGVNEKVEGFFKYCHASGLTGSQGVMIPWQNERHLMLAHNVLEAIDKGQFHVWTVRTIDEGLQLLTGLPAGTRSAKGTYPATSVHGKVMKRLENWMDRSSELAARGMAKAQSRQKTPASRKKRSS